MQSFEFILAHFSSENGSISQSQLIKPLVEKYLQQNLLSQCPTLYHSLLDEWDQGSTPNITEIKQILSAEEARIVFEEAFCNSLKFLFNKELDKIHQNFIHELDNENREKIEFSVIQLIMPYLMARGKTHVAAQARYLSLLFHPDKQTYFTNTIHWLEDRLGKGHCFKLIKECENRIENPQTQIPFNDTDINFASTAEKFSMIIEILKQHAIHSQTYSERLFYKALLELFHNIEDYSNTSVQFESGLSRILCTIIPLTGSLYCISFFAPEILFISALIVTMRFSEGTLQASPHQALNTLGEHFASIRQLLFYNTSTMIFAISSGNLKVTNFASDGLLNMTRLLSGESKTSDHGVRFEGREFKNLSIKFIASHLEKYIDMQKSQWIAGYRQGSTKSLFLGQILQEMESIDIEEISLVEKLDKVEELLTIMLFTPEIITSGQKAKKALNNALNELKEAQQALISPEQQKFYTLFHAVLKPLQAYITEQAMQWGAAWRIGANKADKIYQTLTSLNIIKNNKEISFDEKIEIMRQQLEVLQLDDLINSSGQNARNAINKSLEMFSEDLSGPSRRIIQGV